MLKPLFAVAAFTVAGALHAPAAMAHGAEDQELTNLAGCYADGIDAIGRGDAQAGAAKWKQCFSEDVKFTLSFGAFTMTCPGEKCSLPDTMNGLARRVALAKGTFERAGYVATSHHLTSLTVTESDAQNAVVRAHLQAWHQRKDGAFVVGLGTWEVKARKTAAGWRIAEEQLDSPLRVVMPKAE
jgi:3-phenylpropionate/cinnamic acid dioxygenase small subunit